MHELTRFKLIPQSERNTMALPSSSLFSRTDDDDWFIDTDFDLEMDGRIYIGKRDFEVMAKLVGYAPINEAHELELERLRQENDKYRATLSRITSLSGDLSNAVQSNPRAPESVAAVTRASKRDAVRVAQVDAGLDEPGAGSDSF